MITVQGRAECQKNLFPQLLLPKTSRNAVRRSTVKNTAWSWKERRDAIRLALEKDPSGFFHLIRVGHEAAFQVGWYLSCAR